MPAPDVIVVGAGIAGAASACYLAGAGLDVTLVERERPAAGASGRNPGFLWMQTKTPGPAMTLARRGRTFMTTLASELDDFGFRPCGGMILVRDERLLEVAARFVLDRRAAGLEVELIDRAAVRDLVPLV